MDAPQRQVSPERQAVYYVGMIAIAIGILLFVSTFVTGISNFGNFNNFDAQVQSEGFRAVGGMILIAVGGFLMRIGSRGLAGSGIVLDPEKARKDVEPWSRMGGGVVQDALSEVEVVQKLEGRLEPPAPEIKVRCRNCQALNDEAAKFCNQCGSQM